MKKFSPDIPDSLEDLNYLIKNENYSRLKARNTLTKYIAFEYCLSDGGDDYETFIRNLENNDIYETLRRKSNGETEELKSKRIDFLLDKDKKRFKEPDFFRPYGPMWIDFENQYIVLREEEIEKTLKTFEKNNIVSVNGAPASGKSVFLKSLGYKLAEEIGADVYYFDLNESSIFDNDIKNIAKLKNAYILIDNAHRNREYADNLAKEMLGTSINIIISTRDELSNYFLKYYYHLQFLIKDSIVISPAEIADKIINRYLKIYSNINISGKKENLLPSENLMILLWKLNSLNKLGELNKDFIALEAESHLEKLRLIDLNGQYNASQIRNVFLILSAFYIYEIPVRNNHLTHYFHVEQDLIDSLIRINEINSFTTNKMNRYLSVHHSEIAKIYLHAFMNSTNLNSEYDFNINDEWLGKLYCSYINEYPDELINIFRKSGHFAYFRKIENGARNIENNTHCNKILLREIISKYESSIIKHINAEPSLMDELYNIAEVYHCYCHQKESYSKNFIAFLEKLDPKAFVQKMYKAENINYIEALLLVFIDAYRYTKIKAFHPKYIYDLIDMNELAKTCNGQPELYKRIKSDFEKYL